MSIQPKWCEKIINGEKTIEVRKTAPKETPFKVYIYCTKGKKGVLYKAKSGIRLGYKNDYMRQTIIEVLNERGYRTFNGKVIGEFICDKVESIPIDSEAFAAISKIDELVEDCSGRDMYGLHISALKIYDKPKELSGFRKPDTSCGFYNPDIERCDSGYNCERCVYNDLTITRPPQSWQYIEEIEE